MLPYLILIVQFTLLGWCLWGMLWASRHRSAGPPPQWLRPVVDADGSPRLSFNFMLIGVSVVCLVLIFATTPSRAQQQRQQFDRIEELLREIRDAVQP